MNQKISFPRWFVIILLAAFAVGYWAWSESLRDQNSPNPLFNQRGGKGGVPEGWQTYRNEEYGFEVKYPKDWIFEERFSFQKGFFITDPVTRSEIAILPNGEFDHGLPWEDPVITEEALLGKNFTVHFWELEDGDYLVLYFLRDAVKNWDRCDESLKNCTRIEIGAEDEEILSEANQILSTFRFIE